MTNPLAEAGSLPLQEEDFHRRLFLRSAVLPSGGNQDGRVRLSDAMLGLAVLAPCFALLRGSVFLGIASLVLIFPALVRTHAVMNQGRQDGESPRLGSWMFALISSLFRVGIFFVIIGLMQGLGVLIGGFLGHLVAVARVLIAVGGPSRPLSPDFYSYGGGILGYFLLSLPLTALLLTFLAPRLLSIHDEALRVDQGAPQPRFDREPGFLFSFVDPHALTREPLNPDSPA